MATILILGVPHEMETLRYLCSLTTQREAGPCYFTELSTGTSAMIGTLCGLLADQIYICIIITFATENTW